MLVQGPTRKDFGTRTNFAEITREEVAEAKARFNCRSRKRLNYQTPK
jgi:IS30 family transposase